MKQLVLTALATEQKFGTSEAKYFLVFNDGELRVPVTEEAAGLVVQEMYGNQQEQAPAETPSEEIADDYAPTFRGEEGDDGVAQI